MSARKDGWTQAYVGIEQMILKTPYSLLTELEKVRYKDRPPINLWYPEKVSNLDISISADGYWSYHGSVIARHRLARLFSTLLRLEDDGEYYLITPEEKYRINVADAPFVAISMQEAGNGRLQKLSFTTNMGDIITLDYQHPLRIETDLRSGEPSPYIMVRDNLEAKLSRNVYYQLMELLEKKDNHLGIWSENNFFELVESSECF